MKKLLTAIFLLLIVVVLSGCGAGYVMSELKGTAKPEGGINEVIPETKTYKANHAVLWKAVQDVLDDQGYIFAADSSSGRIKTDPKVLGDQSKLAITGATYSAVVTVKVDGSSVSYRARFNKKSNIVQGTELLEFPEKENELRKNFFTVLDNKLSKK